MHNIIYTLMITLAMALSTISPSTAQEVGDGGIRGEVYGPLLVDVANGLEERFDSFVECTVTGPTVNQNNSFGCSSIEYPHTVIIEAWYEDPDSGIQFDIEYIAYTYCIPNTGSVNVLINQCENTDHHNNPMN